MGQGWQFPLGDLRAGCFSLQERGQTQAPQHRGQAQTVTAALIPGAAAAIWTWRNQLVAVLSVWISLSVNSRQPRTSAQTGITVVARGTDRHHPPAVVSASLGWRLSLHHGESFESSCRRASHSPVLKLLAVDAHSPLVALGDTDLVSAALNLLTRVLSGVYVCGIARKKERCLLKNPHLPGYFLPSFCICSLKSQISLFAQHNLCARRNYQRYTELQCTILWHKSS